MLIGLLAVGALAAALVASGLLLASGNIVSRPDSATLTLSYAGGAIALGSGLAAAVSFVALALLFTPVLLVAIGRLVAEMGANPAWVPAARRYAIGPALALLAPLTAALLVAAWAVANALSWQGSVYAQTTLTTAMASIPLHLTLRSLVFLAVLVVPYLLLLSLPFRVGMSRWRHAWLKGLAARRAEVESHVRRLSATDPRSGTQDTSEENLRSMQYDLVLLQFYRDKIAEAGKTRSPQSPSPPSSPPSSSPPPPPSSSTTPLHCCICSSGRREVRLAPSFQGSASVVCIAQWRKPRLQPVPVLPFGLVQLLDQCGKRGGNDGIWPGDV